ncbi:hypothetical protein PSACC_00334 [Paramicrosporidium saccamoebae]|uniref:t-SNARE coiled-coil homology domain-containing protein n=1 Tax=Paramicrosporidium saccamoebae TaxID=1246581 RepID=A0A2H9TQ43_9FUNG|nr:hypothetical protein PSACC_00334 [Paramicrosporidium saccamoebae]
MFIDLNNMIEEQGALLDSLEGYLGETVEYTEEAEKTMTEAVGTQRNIRKLHCSVVMGVDLLGQFNQATKQAAADGTAYEQADRLERGDPPPTETNIEDEAMNMKHFYEQCEEISSHTKKVEMFTSELDKLHKQALTTTGSEASADTSSKIDIITAKVNQLSNQSRNTLKAIELENSQLKEIAPPASGHMRMRESKHRALATAFLSATKKLQKLQQNYRDKYKQQLERQYKIVNPNATPEEIAQVTKDTEGAQAKIFASAVRDDAKKTLSQMKDRFQDVKTIETSILELHQLFLDLQTLVVEQGDVINRVEYNVDHTLDYTDEAAADMKLAVEYQKSIWKKKWIMIVLIIVGIAAATSPYMSATPPPMVERSAHDGDLELGVLSAATPTDRFLSSIEEVRVRLEKINKSVGDIEHLHRQALNAINMDEATRLGRLIDEMVSRNNADAQFVRQTLKTLTGETENLKSTGAVTSSDLRIRMTQQSRYAKKFMGAMNKFQGMQTTYQGKYRQQLERQYLIVKPNASREELDRLTHSADATAMLNQQKTLAEMKERHQDIIAIEKSIKELHQMFVDMAIIVEQQGELIDKVEDFVTNTAEYTEAAAEEMRGAVVRQRSTQRKKWILTITIIIILAVVGIIVWATWN